MRFVARVVACAGVLLAVAGCDPVDKHYFTRGVGTDLYPDDVANQTNLQNAYVANICRQAGLIPTEYDGTISCGPNPHDPVMWWQFVQAGMNDIDRRCDAYLTWLDNVRRSREPILNQISQTRTATQTILNAAGVGVDPITIVGAAFGLANDIFTNVNSRLITELDHSTVQAVVLSKQTEYRNSLIGDAKNKPTVMITSRPAAIYALRSYLRLCMPMTIETEINNTVATIARSGPDALKRKQPLISAQSVGIATITNPNLPTPPGPQPSPVPPKDTRFGEVERRLPQKTIKAFQRTLCVAPVDGLIGGKGSLTRAAISEYLKTKGEKDTSGELDNRTVILLNRVVRRIGDCRAKFYKNAFEIAAYGTQENPTAAIGGLQRALVRALKTKGVDSTLQVSGKFVDDSNATDPTRTAIAQFRLLSLSSAPPNENEIKEPQYRELNSAINRSIYTAR